MKIKAYVVHEKNGPYLLEDVALAEPNANEILVKNVASGICHTDEFGRSQGVEIALPIVLGHEGAGIVAKVGADVKEFAVGDHVAFSYAFCGHCHNCSGGEPFYCESYNQINFGGVAADGKTKLHQNGKSVSMFFGQSSFATHSVIHQNSAVKVDKEVDLTLVAPLGCGVQTGAGTVLNTLRPSVSDSIAVYGCGSVGLSAIMAAKVAYCQTIIAVGGNEKSLRLAQELGATHTVNRKETPDLTQAIKNITDGKGVHYAIDTSGYGPMIEAAIKALRYHGTMVVLSPDGTIEQFGMGKDVLMNMVTLKGVCEGDALAKKFIPELIHLYKQGKYPLDKLVTVYDFSDLEKAVADSNNGKVIKAVIKM